VLQCVAICCSVSSHECCHANHPHRPRLSRQSTMGVLKCVEVCCSALQCVAACCSVSRESWTVCDACIKVCCSALQCVAV